MRIALTALTPAGPRDVIVTGDDSATVSEVAAGLRAALWPAGRMAEVIQLPAGGDRRTAAPASGTAWVDGRPLDPDSPAVAGLHDGAIVAVDSWSAPATALAEPVGVVEVRTVGGPAAGRVHRLGFGAAIIGAAPDCHVQLGGPGQPDRAARVVVERGPGALTVTAQALPGSAAPLLDGEPLGGPQPWPPGGLLTIGSNVLTLALPEPPDAHLSPGDDGGLAFNRPPRLMPPDRRRRIEVPAEPRRAEKVRLQLISALVPLVLGAVMVKVLHSAVYALFMLMSPVMVVGQWLSDRRHGRTSHQRAMRDYRRRMAELDGVLAVEAVGDQVTRRAAAPDPAEILLTATGPRRRLWERRADDPDALELRIGLADQPARIELVPEADGTSRASLPVPPLARDVPVTLPLASLGVIGLAGPLPASRGLARWLVAQAAVLHSPRDLQIVVLSTDPQAGHEWNWVRWLPHAAARSAAASAQVGTDPESAARRVAELAAEAGERLGRTAGPAGLLPGYGSGGVADPGLGPRILIVLDGARVLRRLPGMPQVLAAARAAGMQAICLDESRRLLPEECAAVISWDDTRPSAVTVQGGGLDGTGLVLADQAGTDWADRLARALAPVRDVSREDADSALPSSARLLDLLALPDPGAADICAAWQLGGRSTSAVVGVGATGPFRLDLAADGPHGLIAGTTGSGKSELLQTIIASLAIVNRPDSMTFVLIDYKGGSAFKDCARLPHTVGMVTDLDGHLTERALASLGAELRRREEVLRDAGAKDIQDYWDARRLSPALPPMPRLVLVIDEFASLVTELPGFVTGLVGIAQRGRSLGVHLLLATQRPAGVVSADIRANTNLRIALRVTDAEESADVIDTRDAAFISRSTPGRCYVRSGAGSPAAVQGARIGGRRPGAGPGGATSLVIPVPWADLGRPLPAGPAAPAGDDLATDLSVLVDAIAAAADRLGIPAQRSPWLPPLPEIVTIGDLPPDEMASHAAAGGLVAVPYGLTDVPSRQAREPLRLDLAHGGHVVIAGAARTGRSTALRSIAGSVAAGVSPADVHLYAIDCGAGAMLPLAALPHCGAVVSRDQADRVERLLGKLRGEIMRRQQLLAADGLAGLAEQRAASQDGQRLPWMVLLIDWWEGFVAAFEQYDYGRLIELLLQTLREGAAVGMRAVVTTDRAALLGQAGTVFGQRMVLRLADRADATLAGIGERSLPASQPPGRVMLDALPSPVEAQVAMLDPDPSGPAQVAALRRLGAAAEQRHGRPSGQQRPLRVDPLPARITAAQTRELDRGFRPPSPLWVLAGAGGDDLAPQGFDLRDEGPGAVLAGPPRSGRSSTLCTMAGSLLAQGTPVVLVTPRRSPLRGLAGADGLLAVLGAEADEAELAAATEGHDRYVVLVDDAELLTDSRLSRSLEQVLLSGRDADLGLVLAGPVGDLGRAYSGFIPTALKSRCGILLGVESPSDGDLFGVRLPRGAGPGPLGRGLLIRPGSVAPVQLAVPDERPAVVLHDDGAIR